MTPDDGILPRICQLSDCKVTWALHANCGLSVIRDADLDMSRESL